MIVLQGRRSTSQIPLPLSAGAISATSYHNATPHPLVTPHTPQVVLGDPVDSSESPTPPLGTAMDLDSIRPSSMDEPPPATTSGMPYTTGPLATVSSSSRSQSSPTRSSERPRRSREGFWRTTEGGDHGSPGSVAHSRATRENGAQPDTDVEMTDVTTLHHATPPVTTNKPISLVFRMPPAVPVRADSPAADEVSASTRSSPDTSHRQDGAGSKKKRKSEPPLNPNRPTRGRRSSPQLSTPRAGTSNETSPAPSGSLSIFAPPPPSDTLPDALQSALAPSTPIPVENERAPLVDADAIRREAAAGFESRLRSRAKPRDGGERSGISASGKGVRVGGSSRAAAQQVVQSGPSKKKGKGKSGEGDVPNQDFCSACRGIGRFLCCDGCPRSFHFMCLEPPLRVDELPEEETWYCKECQARRAKDQFGSPVKEKDLKPIPMAFKKLFQRVEGRNPSQYRLPDEVRLHFAGVAEAPKGEYVDADEARTKFDRKGFQEERDPFRTQHKNRTIQCFACGGTCLPSQSLTSDPESAGRPIVSCDYCSLHWHLDCLTPPLASMPNSGRKWMCPNHVEQVMPRRRTIRNGLEVVDVDSPHTRNNGNITIVPEVETPRLPPLEYEDMVINKKTFRVPERIIKLDFWEKLKSVNKSSQKIRPEIDEDGDEIPYDPPTDEDLNAANLILSLLKTRPNQPSDLAKEDAAEETHAVLNTPTPTTANTMPVDPSPSQISIPHQTQLATPLSAVHDSAHESKGPKIVLRMPGSNHPRLPDSR